MKDSTKQQDSAEPVDTGNPHAKRHADKTSGKEPMPTLPGTKAETINYITKYLAGLEKGTMDSVWQSLLSKAKAHEFGGGQSGNEKNARTIVAKEDLEDLFKSLEVSEEFIEKARTIFEAALEVRMTEKEVELEETYQSAYAEAVEEYQKKLDEQVSDYLKVVAEDFVAKNELAVVSSVKADLSESFMAGLKNLFIEHFIEMPEEKRDIYEEAVSENAELLENLNATLEENLDLRKEIDGLKRTAIVNELSEGMTVTEKERFIALVETLDADTVDAFAKKATILKESTFSKDEKSKSLNEDSLNGGAPITEEKKDKTVGLDDPLMAAVHAAIKKTVVK